MGVGTDYIWSDLLHLHGSMLCVSHLALDQKCRHALYQCIKCLLAGTFIRVTEFNYQKTNNKSIHDCSLCSVM